MGLSLGQTTVYPDGYNPSLLFPISRPVNRKLLGISGDLPFYGQDTWHHYEVSWLKPNGIPEAVIAKIILPCESEFLIESKSMKLYFNSLNMEKFESREVLRKLVEQDLSQAAQAKIQVKFFDLSENLNFSFGKLAGESLDNLSVKISDYHVNSGLLKLKNPEINITKETLSTQLFRSLCPVTSQPDWAGICINYSGPQLCREGLLAYLISYRTHLGFHEDCVERIFMDLKNLADFKELTVMGYFTRRGGLDINPVRTTNPNIPEIIRLFRQ